MPNCMPGMMMLTACCRSSAQTSERAEVRMASMRLAAQQTDWTSALTTMQALSWRSHRRTMPLLAGGSQPCVPRDQLRYAIRHDCVLPLDLPPRAFVQLLGGPVAPLELICRHMRLQTRASFHAIGLQKLARTPPCPLGGGRGRCTLHALRRCCLASGCAGSAASWRGETTPEQRPA